MSTTEAEKLCPTLKEKQVQKYKDCMQIQNVNTEFFQKLDQCLTIYESNHITLCLVLKCR